MPSRILYSPFSLKTWIRECSFLICIITSLYCTTYVASVLIYLILSNQRDSTHLATSLNQRCIQELNTTTRSRINVIGERKHKPQFTPYCRVNERLFTLRWTDLNLHMRYASGDLKRRSTIWDTSAPRSMNILVSSVLSNFFIAEYN